MLEIILACDENFGIGKNGTIPWKCDGDLSLFRKKTQNSVLIVGRKTAEKLPKLENRTVIALSKTVSKVKHYLTFTNIYDAIYHCKLNFKGKKIFIAGGAEIYDFVFKNMFWYISNIYVSKIKNKWDCDSFVNLNFLTDSWVQTDLKIYDEFKFEHWIPENFDEYGYLNLLREVFEHGKEKEGRNGTTKSLFGKTLSFDLRKGFPLLTTKKMFFRGIVEELLFFIKGETDTKKLEEKQIYIWKGNTSREFLDSLGMTERREGIMGPMYGFQWRNFNGDYNEETGKTTGEEKGNKGIDQLKDVIYNIKNDPNSRRILMTNYNPCQSKAGVLYPCHSIILQFYVDENFLDMTCYNRSQDLFLGTPFNIASSALLLSLIAKVCDLIPRHLYLNLGDVHIYNSHLKSVEIQLKRPASKPPKLKINKILTTIEDLENLLYEEICLVDYKSADSIKAEMVA